jgi:1-acyl-sn-glycerol-3-phosphate acyltransferase
MLSTLKFCSENFNTVNCSKVRNDVYLHHSATLSKTSVFNARKYRNSLQCVETIKTEFQFLASCIFSDDYFNAEQNFSCCNTDIRLPCTMLFLLQALLECVIGTRVIVIGDAILPHDKALIVMNHRTRLDWNFLWAGIFHACKPLAHRIKMVLKASIRHIPGAGNILK